MNMSNSKTSILFLLFSAVAISTFAYPFSTGGMNFPAGYGETRSESIVLCPVTVHGAGLNSGTMYVPSAHRVLDVVRIVSGDSLRLRQIDCRDVTVRTGKTVRSLDLLRYISLGDETQNPYVANGMDITVRYARNFAWVYGDIQGFLLGQVPFKQGETAGELLSLYTLNPTADTSHVLFRREGDTARVLKLSDLSSITLSDRDYLSVIPLPDVRTPSSVLVQGEAARPGRYPIDHGKTRVLQLLESAGGASSEGDLSRAFIIRGPAAAQQASSSAYLNASGAVRPEILAGMRHLAGARDWTVIPVLTGEVALEDSDVVVIPRKELCVYVSGAVKKPGAVAFTADKEVADYIALAGGYGKSADHRNVRVVTPWSDGVIAITDVKSVRAGDVIVVPEAEEDKWLKRWVPVMQMAVTALSLILVIINVSR